MEALDRRLASLDRRYRLRDEQFATLVAPIVGMAEHIRQLQKDHRVLYAGVDLLVKSIAGLKGGLAELEAATT